MIKFLICLSILTICCDIYSQENCNSSRIKYLEANPDVKNSTFDPWYHYTTYGKKEGRVWEPCSDKKTRDSRPKDQANVYWNGEFALHSLTSDIEILPNSSGEYVFWGTTNENPVPKEYKMKVGTFEMVYKFIDYQECLLFCNEVRKAKGLNLLEVPSILNRGKWEAKGKTVFEKSLNQEWVESSNGNSFVYNEVSADERGVLLKDRNRNGVFIYLENDKCQYKDLNTDWIIVYYGNWIDDKAEILITDEDKVITENDIKILLGDTELETPVSDKNIFTYPKNESELLKKYFSFEDKWTGIQYLKFVIKNTTATDENSILIFALAHLFKIIDQSIYYYKSTLISQEEWNSNYEMLSMFPANLIQKGEGKRAFYLFAFIVCGQKTNNNTIQYWKAILEEFNSENCPLGAEFYAQCKKVTDEYSNNLKLAEEKQAKVNSDNLLKSQLFNYFSQGVTNGIKEAMENFKKGKLVKPNNTSNSQSSNISSGDKVYICNKCQITIVSTSKPEFNSNVKCPFDNYTHDWRLVGESGIKNFQCKGCSTIVRCNSKPEYDLNIKCPAGDPKFNPNWFGAKPHIWIEIK